MQLQGGETVADSYFGRHLKKLCSNREPERPKKDGKNVSVYPGLIFYKGKFDTAISELKKSRDVSVSGAFGSVRNQSVSILKTKSGQQTSISEASKVNLWNLVVSLFGGKEAPNLAGTSVEHPENASVTTKTASIDSVTEELASEVPAVMPQNQIDTELEEAKARAKEKEEHFFEVAQKLTTVLGPKTLIQLIDPRSRERS